MQALRLSSVVTAAALAGCQTLESINPIDWWHDTQSGPIAQTRPPPPKADAPYPNLASVPDKPAPLDAATRNRIASGLIADRTNAHYTEQVTPIQALPPATQAPARPAPAKTDDDTSSASLPAASAPRGPLGPPQPPLPNVPSTPPRRAPVAGVQTAPLDAPPGAPPDAASAATPPSSPASTPASPAAPPATTAASPPAAPPPEPARPAPARTASAAPARATAPSAAPAAPTGPRASASIPSPGADLPALPDRAPPPPRLAGVDVPAVTAPTPPPATPPPPPPPPAPSAPAGAVAVAFPPGSSALPPTALASLKLLVQRRGEAPIAVTGYGEATSTAADAQSAALPLALARARAIAANLLAAGVPANQIRVGAEAVGNGGAARVVN